MNKNHLPGLPFGARNIFCIGRNYAAHARELKNEIPQEPVVFLKPVSALCYSGESVKLPRASARVDHEVEIVVALGQRCQAISEAQALEAVAGYAVGLDLTARDLQEIAKKGGLPWAVAKGFDGFAPVSSFLGADVVGDPAGLCFELEVNGETRQRGRASDMLFSIPSLIAYLSGIFTLEPGDLIFTGTPAGVGPLVAGDSLKATLKAARSEAGLEINVK